MATIRFQLLATNLSARVRNRPGIGFWVLFFATETGVPGGYGGLGIVLATLRTVPVEDEHLLGHILALVRVVARLVLVVHLFLGNAVIGPSLDAGEVQEAVAVLTRPYRLGATDTSDTDETCGRVRRELVLQRVLRFRQILDISSIRFEHGFHQLGHLHGRLLVLLLTGLVRIRVHRTSSLNKTSTSIDSKIKSRLVVKISCFVLLWCGLDDDA